MHLIANKAEGRAADAGLMEAYNLGFGEAGGAVSAEHGQGLADLHAIVSKAVDDRTRRRCCHVDELPEVDIDLPEDDGSTEDGPPLALEPQALPQCRHRRPAQCAASRR